MKKLIASAVLLSVVAALLAGCAGEPTDQTGGKAPINSVKEQSKNREQAEGK